MTEVDFMGRKEETIKQYEILVNSSMNVTKWRLETNRFFLTINGALLGAIVYVDKILSVNASLVSYAGMILSILWFFNIKSLKTLNKAKFDIIHKMEANLPYKTFSEEEKNLEKENYMKITTIESYVPFVFFILFFLISISVV